jgi:hypothetical protein
MSNQTQLFCSDLSRNACEPLYGTAGLGQVWLLLEHPQSWGEKALETSQLPGDVKTYLRSVLKGLEGGRFLLIRQRRSEPDSINFFIAVTREQTPRIKQFKLRSYEDLLQLDIPKLAGQAQNDKESLPLYLVCTDGKHDKCCAKYGLRAYQTLKARFGESVWESSHVGGDRFAANIVCLPHGLYFGRVTEAEAERVLGDYQDGKIFLGKYRGRSCYSHHIQVGEYFIRSRSGNLKIDSLRFLDEEAMEDDQWQVRFSSAGDRTIHTVRFRRELSSFEIPSSCHSEEKRRVAQYSLIEYTCVEHQAILSVEPNDAYQMSNA